MIPLLIYSKDSKMSKMQLYISLQVPYLNTKNKSTFFVRQGTCNIPTLYFSIPCKNRPSQTTLIPF
jgi:hypothetical protein